MRWGLVPPASAVTSAEEAGDVRYDRGQTPAEWPTAGQVGLVDGDRIGGRQHDRFGSVSAPELAGVLRRDQRRGVDLHRGRRDLAGSGIRAFGPGVSADRWTLRVQPPGVRRLHRLPDRL